MSVGPWEAVIGLLLTWAITVVVFWFCAAVNPAEGRYAGRDDPPAADFDRVACDEEGVTDAPEVKAG